MKTQILIVGAGLTGATLAERFASVGKRVLVVDRRDHIAGNAYDEHDAHGVLVHRYGPHIFHTNSKKVWEYLSRFTAWRPYYHRVLGVVDGKEVPIPFNLQSLRLLFPPRLADLLEEKLVRRFGLGARVPILRLKEEGDEDLKLLSEYVYEKVFLGYTLKQWGMRPEDLSPSVTARVPLLVSYDDRYFQDTYQAMPEEGYTAMVRRMLSHPNIRVLLRADWRDLEGEVRYEKLIFTGPIDEFFGYKHGPLPYRSLSFRFQTLPTPWHQRVGTVNYPNEHPYTRVTEFKHLTGQGYLPHTTVVYEYPEAYVPGQNEPYYPIPREENEALYQRYLDEAKELEGVYFAGRLGDYRYYNMDQAVARALKLFEELAYG
ncbi:UDP-galactopyranose mutase [Thermus oshimai JL-2]|uniref:UDP-galactopyranose mutase n=1 Tax=Thermus oshimai JL-2 TaxID=751945 RepID=K7R6L4_THEOS|nr:UDP-galactopyranose mutase [Thermus oshimai]AFV76574.1 UDP-galactopyranose mutase [Thermus oshimai JL-2]